MKRQKTTTTTRPPTPDPRPLLAYFLLTILMTWPAILHLTAAIPGDGFDGWQNYWNLWWVKKALLELGTNPFFTDYLYPPQGASLLFHTLNIFNGLWTLPLQLNFGLAIAYNSVVFVSFVLAGYGGYLLSLYTLNQLRFPHTKGLRPAAFVGGLVFTMSPFHLAHLLGHMQVFSMIWPPFYVLWLLRILTSPPTSLLGGEGGRVKQEVRNVAIACLFLIMATLVDWYHTLYLLIFTGLVLLWTFNVQRSTFKRLSLRPVWLVLAIGMGFSLVLSPLLIPMMRAARTTPELQTGLEQSITLSADLLAFILPSEMHPLWGEWTQIIAANFSSTLSERLVFAGFVPLALTLFIIIRGWQSLIIKFWTFITASFFILALGPYLHLGGKIITLGDWPIPLPYLLLYRFVPFIRLTRSLSRYDLMVMLGLGVLVAIALAYLSARTADRRRQTADQLPATSRKILNTLFTIHYSQFRAEGPLWAIHHWLPLLATLLICFEFLPIPYPISKIDTPQFYFDLAAQREDFTIAELPLNWDRPTPLLYQTVHGKRLLTAYTSRDNPLELAWRTPVLQHWRYLGPDIIDQPLDVIAPTIFYDFNLRYIVLDYWQMPPGPEREATERWVAAALPGATPIYNDGRLKVYQAPPKQETQPYLTLGDGWSKRQANETDFVTRTFPPAERPPELFLHHPQNRPLVLEVTATVAQGPAQNLTLLAFDQPVSIIQVTQILSTQAINLPPFPDDLVKLSFHADNPTGLVSILSLSLKEE